jgi:hypothetical protein
MGSSTGWCPSLEDCPEFIGDSPEGISAGFLMTPFGGALYTYSHKEVIDNIAFSDQEPFSSESGSWLFGVVFNNISQQRYAIFIDSLFL